MAEVVGAIGQGPAVAKGEAPQKVVLQTRNPNKENIALKVDSAKNHEDYSVKVEGKENVPPQIPHPVPSTVPPPFSHVQIAWPPYQPASPYQHFPTYQPFPAYQPHYPSHNQFSFQPPPYMPSPYHQPFFSPYQPPFQYSPYLPPHHQSPPARHPLDQQSPVSPSLQSFPGPGPQSFYQPSYQSAQGSQQSLGLDDLAVKRSKKE